MKIDRKKLLCEEAARKNRAKKEYIEKLKERDRAKKPDVDDEMGYFVCPSCKSAITYTDEKETHKFCLKCGQRINWTEQENGGIG